MKFKNTEDKNNFLLIKRHLSRENIRERLSSDRETLVDAKKMFYYYKGSKNGIGSGCLGKDDKEAKATNHYQNITKDNLSYDDYDVPLQETLPLPCKEKHRPYYSYLRHYFSKYVLSGTIMALLFSAALLLLFALGHWWVLGSIMIYGKVSYEELMTSSYYQFWESISLAKYFYAEPSGDNSFIWHTMLFPLFPSLFLFIFNIFLLIIVVPFVILPLKNQSFNHVIDVRNKVIEEKIESVKKQNEIIVQSRNSKRLSEINKLKNDYYLFTVKNAKLFYGNYCKQIDINKGIQELTDRLTVILEDDFEYIDGCSIHEKYKCDLVALSSFVDYFETGRCITFTGPGGAIDLYETDIYRNEVMSRFDKIELGISYLSNQIDDLKKGQLTLAMSIESVNKSVHGSQNAIENCLNSIDYHTNDIINAIHSIPLPTTSGTVYSPEGRVIARIA